MKRDWGWAPEYVDAMWRMLQQERPEDYVIATGRTRSLEEFVAAAFAAVGLDWREHVESIRRCCGPADIEGNYANLEKASRVLGWRAGARMEETVRSMVDAERERGLERR